MSREPSSLAAVLATIASTLRRPVSAVQALLESDFKLRRVGRRLRIVVARPGDESRSSSMPAPSTQSAPVDAVTQGMHTELRRLLAQHGQTRALMRHLSYV